MGKWGIGGLPGASFWKTEFQVEDKVDVEPTEYANWSNWKSSESMKMRDQSFGRQLVGPMSDSLTLSSYRRS